MWTPRQEQIVIGTVLGGSSLIRPPKGTNCYLSMCSQNNIWLKYKMAELTHVFPKPRLYQSGTSFRCNSACDSCLTELRELLYLESERTIDMDLLDRLRDIGIVMWYLDGGGKTGRNKKNAYLNTTKYKQEGSEIISQFFNEVNCHCSINKNKNRLRVVFSVQGTESFFKIIAPLFPQFMFDRL